MDRLRKELSADDLQIEQPRKTIAHADRKYTR